MNFDLSTLTPEQIKALAETCPELLQSLTQHKQINKDKVEIKLNKLVKYLKSKTKTYDENSTGWYGNSSQLSLRNSNLECNKKILSNIEKLNEMLETCQKYLIIAIINTSIRNNHCKYIAEISDNLLNLSIDKFEEMSSIDISRFTCNPSNAYFHRPFKSQFYSNLILIDYDQYQLYKLMKFFIS